MAVLTAGDELFRKYVVVGDHGRSDYFGLIKELVARRNKKEPNSVGYRESQDAIDAAYDLVQDELTTNSGRPRSPVKFGTSGWRGMIGKDLFVDSVARVTLAIVEMYRELDSSEELAEPLGVKSLGEARTRGAVVGFDNRFGGELMGRRATEVLTAHGFTVYYAGESTTGALSASVLELKAAFSINLTPSHNPLEYGGFKYNAADAGPASAILTDRITTHAARITALDKLPAMQPDAALVRPINALDHWQELVRRNSAVHGLDYDGIMARLAATDNMVVAVDCVHGASRVHVDSLFKGVDRARLEVLRGDADPTFGGIAPEPSPINMVRVIELLGQRSEPLKLGMILDPDGDRIRFTDGTVDISMNQFGAMAYHFLHEHKKLKGMVAKTVATSNFANELAAAFDEEVFEPKVGFKEFKPVIGRALVCFEESDGITVIGHTPEKDAYIGLLLALDMVLTLGKNLGDYLAEIQGRYGAYFPAKDGVVVTKKGAELQAALAGLEKYKAGALVPVGDTTREIARVIDIDGRKMILADNSWVMIRPSGTEPKVRFYVEARNEKDTSALFETARNMLSEIGLL